MIVCHCMGVTDREIRAAVRKGARTRAEVARVCKAGAGCGGCTPLVDRLLALEARTSPPSPSGPRQRS